MSKFVQHLEYLASNVTAYNEYFWWKEYHDVVMTDTIHALGGGKYVDILPEHLNPFCNFCKALNGKLEPKRTYPNSAFHHWWNRASFCAQGPAVRTH